MGYTTDFYGEIEIVPALPIELVNYINEFKGTRRMKRNTELLQQKYNGEHGFNGQYGIDGEYFIGGEGFAGQGIDSTVISSNNPPDTQPGLWCQWQITEDGKWIEWDGGEKFYESEAWMKYIIDNFIAPFGHICNGKIEAQGEEQDDHWMLIVKDNEVTSEEFVHIVAVDGRTCTLRELLESLHESGVIASSEQLEQAYNVISDEGFTLDSMVVNQ